MFEFFFKYSPTVYEKGSFVLLSRYPVWVLAVAVSMASGLLGWLIWRRRERLAAGLSGWRPAAVWALQSSLAALLLLLLWHPAISVATLKPQQNIVAIVVDDSRSMALREDGGTRREQAAAVLKGGLVAGLRKRFQVRMYRFGERLERIGEIGQVTAGAQATHLGDSLRQLSAESAALPIGAVVLLSDGADNSGGIGLETISEIRRRRIPVHAIGFGREQFARDVELSDVTVPARVLADSRLSAQVTLRQHGYAQQKARLTVSDAGKVLASREIVFGAEGEPQVETVDFNAGVAGARGLDVAVAPLAGEENLNNNMVARLINVEAFRPRLLYLEGDPRWELKFIRRAVEEDRSLQITSILRTTQNKIYVQGVDKPKEFEDGFPTAAEVLFRFQGLIIGDVEASYFTPAQQELVRQFADRRGGGVLFLGGRAALADGGYGQSPLADLLPVVLPTRKGTFRRDPATVELTAAGRDSLICRLEEEAERNAQRWKKLPALADYQEAGSAKPGALVLAESVVGGRQRSPLLVTQNFGRGRSAVMATGGSWRWKMLQEHTDRMHEMFWQQLLRWLVAESPSQVTVSTPRQVIADEARIPLRAEVRDKAYAPAADARVEARILGPDGASASVTLAPAQGEPGVYQGEWAAEKPGSYLVEAAATRGAEELGRDVMAFRREDGVAENFRAEQNRELLEKLADETGGRYYRPQDAAKLTDEISYSEAGITTREARDLWDMPALFLALIALKSAEWLLRRRWGVV
ncbi:MAG TPA: hypothetical protein VLE22_05015 [Bryobacteraceae bacterium]|nr:hypothetical protein [Bryobacteraceae bacterium]